MNFTLPVPPSVNRIYGVTHDGKYQVYKKRDVKSWEWDAGWQIRKQKKGKMLEGRITMAIHFFYSRDRDIDNGLKVLLDLMQHLRVYENDKQIVFLTVAKSQDTKNPRVEIGVNEKGGE